MKFKNLRHYFLPHPETHHKAHLLHWHYLIIYILLFILLKVGFDLFSFYQPGVLGVNSNITVAEVVEKTNKERERAGLAPLVFNEKLSKAAEAKAQNMFEENYWAHFSPSGKDPWGFILASGYKFSYAGENLARNFYNSDEVVKAWMNSPTHRDNIVSSRYTDIGIAVVEGVLQGQRTTLVVQEFGRPYEAIAQGTPPPSVQVSGQKYEVSPTELAQERPVLAVETSKSVSPAIVDPYLVTKDIGMLFVFGLGILILLDLYVLKRRGVFRVSSHHLAHMSLLALAGTSLMSSSGRNDFVRLKFSIMNVMVILSPVFLLGVYYFRNLPYLQIQVISIAAITYLCLAVLHHLKDKTIHLDLILEYVFIALLILVLVSNLSF